VSALRLVFAVAVAASLFACDAEKCSEDNCGGWGGASTKMFNVCTTSSTMLLRDSSGNLIYSCTPDYTGIGDANNCADKFAAQKSSWCQQ